MVTSEWKSSEEIQYALSGKQNIAVFSCNLCANINGTGGIRGLRRMKALLKEWGKRIVVAKTVNACCPEEIMRQYIKKYIKPNRIPIVIIDIS